MSGTRTGILFVIFLLISAFATQGFARQDTPDEPDRIPGPKKDLRPYNLFIEIRPGHYIYWAETDDDQEYTFKRQQMELRIGYYPQSGTDNNFRAFHGLSYIGNKQLGDISPFRFSYLGYFFGSDINLAGNRLYLHSSFGFGISVLKYEGEQHTSPAMSVSLGIGYPITPKDSLYLTASGYCRYKRGLAGPEIDGQETEVIIGSISLGMRHSFNLFRNPPRATGCITPG